MAPSGVPILRPPAKALPPGTEWQATQSPARARYSPWLLGAETLSSARAAAPAISNANAPKSAFETMVTALVSPAGVVRFFKSGNRVAGSPESCGCRSGRACFNLSGRLVDGRAGGLAPLRAQGLLGQPGLDRAAQVDIADRQRPDALARGGEDGVCHRRGDRRDGRLAGAAP